jgi:hypothetical protein
VGSYRRGADCSGDVDFLFTHHDWRAPPGTPPSEIVRAAAEASHESRRQFLIALVWRLQEHALLAFSFTDPAKDKAVSEHFAVSYMGVTAPHPCFAATDAATGQPCELKHRRVDIKAYPIEEMVRCCFSLPPPPVFPSVPI